MTPAATPRSYLAAILRAEDLPWPVDQSDAVLAACHEEGLSALVHSSARRLPSYAAWPQEVRDHLEREARTAAATELLVREELLHVLNALAAARITPILLKGTPLAYSLYQAPSLRQRDDTDLLVPADRVDATRTVLTARGYVTPPYSAGTELLGQFPLVRRDDMDLDHWLDVHWEISAARVFAAALTYEELAASAVNVPALGPHARTPDTVHTLLLSCMHPVMHHRNAVRLAWIYDIHLLAARMDADAWQSFVALATEKRLRSVCAHGLNLAQEWLGTAIPSSARAALTADGDPEPTAAYLAPSRGWLDELGSELTARASWLKRFRLLREVALPSPTYMLGSYGLGRGPSGWAALPLLYLHRGLRGVWRVASGAK